MWMAPTFSAFFGDAFIEKSTLEASSNLAWSYEVLNYAIQQMQKHKLLQSDAFSFPHSVRVALSDTLHIMQQSSLIFKFMLRLLKTPTESQLLSFLRKLKKAISAINIGDTLLLPILVEGKELIVLLERPTDRAFKVAIIQTDPYGGLGFHAASLKNFEVLYRNCLILNNVPKKNCLDDVFWMALYNMSIHNHQGDTRKFYDILLPFLTGQPLESSLVEVETLAQSGSRGGSSDVGEYRLPQKSQTAYVRCVLEAFEFLLKKRNVTDLQAKQV